MVVLWFWLKKKTKKKKTFYNHSKTEWMEDETTVTMLCTDGLPMLQQVLKFNTCTILFIGKVNNHL